MSNSIDDIIKKSGRGGHFANPDKPLNLPALRELCEKDWPDLELLEGRVQHIHGDVNAMPLLTVETAAILGLIRAHRTARTEMPKLIDLNWELTQRLKLAEAHEKSFVIELERQHEENTALKTEVEWMRNEIERNRDIADKNAALKAEVERLHSPREREVEMIRENQTLREVLGVAAQALESIEHWKSDMRPATMPCCFPEGTVRNAKARIDAALGAKPK